MPQTKIEKLEIFPLKKIADERGMVLHMIKNSSPYFSKFGEIYFSIVNPGIIKGWKFHKEMTQYFAVPSGEMKLVFFDDREGSATRGNIKEIILGLDNYYLVKVPPQIWYAFQAISSTAALMANCADRPHDPLESITKEIGTTEIPYTWSA